MATENNKEKYVYDYPHPAVTTDCVVFGFDGRDLKVLLIKRGIEPFKGMWAFPGGFMLMHETAEECAIRELKEETGLELKSVKQLGAFSGIHRDPRERVVTIAFYALAAKTVIRGGDDAADACWFAIDDIPQLAFDHDYILRHAMKRIREDIHFEPVGFDLLDEEFSMSELQRLYESILGVHFDRRNFYKKMMQTGILKEVTDDSEEAGTSADDVLYDRGVNKKQNTFYGEHKEMRNRSIDELFAPQGGAGHSSKQAIPTDTFCYCENAISFHDEIEKPRPLGRPGKRFRFDKEGYNRMKENGNFRLEF